jgi:hypothetical protein
MNCTDIKPGDIILGMLGGTVPKELLVTAIDHDVICAGLRWKCDRATGAEVGQDLGWGPQFGVTGPFINDCRSS